jgi:DNA transformation protein
MKLGEMPSLGPKSQVMLERAGIHTADQLRQLGAIPAFVAVRRSGVQASLNLLWALESALSGKPWQQVARDDRTSLLLALEQYEKGQS